MTLFECLKTFIDTVPGLAAKVPNGVFPAYIPQDVDFPLAVVRYISGTSERPTHDTGPSPWSQVRLEFTFWGGDYIAMEQAAGILANAFEVPTAIYLGGVGHGLFCPRFTNGPRDVRDETRRASGIQLDVIGLLNSDTLS